MTNDLFSQAGQISPDLDPLAAAAKNAAEEAVGYKARYERARDLQRLLDTLVSYRDKGWLLHFKEQCDREADRLKALRDEGQPSVSFIEQVYRDAQGRAKRLPTTMPSDIERLALSTGIPIDRRSRHPRYFFGRDGFLEARVDDQKLTVTVSTREGRIATKPADPEAILETVDAESERLFGRKFSGARFLALVRKAYLAVIKTRKGARDGDPIPLRSIYSQIVKKAKTYKRDEFLVDLSMLVEQGPAETSGWRFDLQQTKDTEQGLLLLGTAGRGMVNLLVFKKSNATAQ